MKKIKIFLICGLAVLLVSCAAEKKTLSEREQEAIEEQARLQWEEAQKKMAKDGFAKEDKDGSVTWKKNMIKQRLKVLNRKQLNRSGVGSQESEDTKKESE